MSYTYDEDIPPGEPICRYCKLGIECTCILCGERMCLDAYEEEYHMETYVHLHASYLIYFWNTLRSISNYIDNLTWLQSREQPYEDWSKNPDKYFTDDLQLLHFETSIPEGFSADYPFTSWLQDHIDDTSSIMNNIMSPYHERKKMFKKWKRTRRMIKKSRTIILYFMWDVNNLEEGICKLIIKYAEPVCPWINFKFE